MNLSELLAKSRDGCTFTRDEVEGMLALPAASPEAMQLMAEGARISRELTDNLAEVQGQFALNLSPCPVNCQFCSFSSEYQLFTRPSEISAEAAIQAALDLERIPENTAILLMTTADYGFGKLLEMSREVKGRLKPETTLIANVSDMSYEKARQLKDAGFHGVYHAVRLGEGSITRAPKQQRLRSIRNFQEAGLIVGTCVEPIGPEHGNAEIAEHILLAASFDPAFSGAARRITIPGSKLEARGMISELRMSQIVAVTRIATPRTVLGNCTHEPCVIGAAAGANLFWAESGANPRDTKEKTEEGRGLSVADCVKLFAEADWRARTGPSRYYAKSHGMLIDAPLS